MRTWALAASTVISGSRTRPGTAEPPGEPGIGAVLRVHARAWSSGSSRTFSLTRTWTEVPAAKAASAVTATSDAGLVDAHRWRPQRA